MARNGLWPTPTVAGNHNRAGASAKSGDGLSTAVKMWRTPQARDGDRRGAQNGSERLAQGHSMGLSEQVQSPEQWPTPNARDWKDTGPSQGNRKSPNLGTEVHRWPTPTSSDATGGPGHAESSTGAPNLRTEAGGALNPTWVEWLMGFPLGWTECDRSATP
jgi:hypothetical protein